MKVVLILRVLKCSQVFRMFSSYVFSSVSSVQDFFFYLGFLSRTTFTNLWTAANGGGHFFNSLLQAWGAWGGAPPPILRFFFENRPIKTDAPPNGVHPPLKNEAPDLKNTPPLPH